MKFIEVLMLNGKGNHDSVSSHEVNFQNSTVSSKSQYEAQMLIENGSFQFLPELPRKKCLISAQNWYFFWYYLTLGASETILWVSQGKI